jgi:hydrogenase large subunit
MAKKKQLDITLHRVEGDLAIRAEIGDGRCTAAWCTGTLYRGFERIIVGRAALDGLVITPRVCGICSTAHLLAATQALEGMNHLQPPAKAVLLRNISLCAEMIQSDIRHGLISFAADLTNEAHREQPLYGEAVDRYEPLKGHSFIEAVKRTKKLLEVVAIIGGQWPHSAFIVPGGIASVPTRSDLIQCLLLVQDFRRWYEQHMLGGECHEWLALDDGASLEAWLDGECHRNGEVGFFLRYGRAIGLDTMGQGNGCFLSYGGLNLPGGTTVRQMSSQDYYLAGGFHSPELIEPFDQQAIAEHLDHSWYAADNRASHPLVQRAAPYATGAESRRYSWAKAPRYNGQPAETGPLAEAMVQGLPLFRSLVGQQGTSAWLRQLARLVRPALLLPALEQWIMEGIDHDGPTYEPPGSLSDGQGWGTLEAARGALGHWVKVKQGKIDLYQIITPTGWNASPRDNEGVPGPMETALIGTAVANPDNPIELEQVARSFDPCLVCTVHAVTPSSVGQAPTIPSSGVRP